MVKKHYANTQKAMRSIVGSEVPGLTAHGLRHSFASVAADLGYSLLTIKGLLGHAGGSITEKYVHRLDTALVAAADRVSRHINGCMNGIEESKIVPFRTA